MIKDKNTGFNIPAHPERSQVYSSQQISKRRSRILRETRKLINECGLKGFSIRKLCRRAEVAPRTIYNHFHNKDRLIGLAIREAYDEVLARPAYSNRLGSVHGAVQRAIRLNRGNLGAKHYAEAVVTIYFDPGTPADLWNMLHNMSIAGTASWLNQLQAEGKLESWANADSAATHMVSMQYSVIRNWVAGQIDDEEYIYRIVEASLMTIVSVTLGEVRKDACALLEEMNVTGKIPEFPDTTIQETEENHLPE